MIFMPTGRGVRWVGCCNRFLIFSPNIIPFPHWMLLCVHCMLIRRTRQRKEASFKDVEDKVTGLIASSLKQARVLPSEEREKVFYKREKKTEERTDNENDDWVYQMHGQRRLVVSFCIFLCVWRLRCFPPVETRTHVCVSLVKKKISTSFDDDVWRREKRRNDRTGGEERHPTRSDSRILNCCSDSMPKD